MCNLYSIATNQPVARRMGGAKRYPSLHFMEVMGFAGLNPSYVLSRNRP
jgi:hypothetical protein